jgi:S1-C subfamily serine protease
MRKSSVTPVALAAFATALVAGVCLYAQDVDKRVLEAEKKRIEVVDKVKPSVVAVFEPNGQGGGSGVLISKDGYALTNFHVVGRKVTMKAGLPDGVLYDAVLVGLDKVGDVALIKLLPKQEGKDFPFAELGDSDKVKAGDWSLAMGNPFLLATDFNPTVTFGLVSGVHRYQYPEGQGLLEYTDCIQIDTSINPGNSGGPLFDMDGKLIGINGRGSFDKRSRINSGVGYAISINQIKNFMGHLHAGIDTDHATLGATVGNDADEESTRMVVRGILDECDAHRRGLDLNDELVSFAGRPIGNVNEFKNVLGIYPKGWRLPLVYRHENDKHEVLVRLMGSQAKIIEDPNKKPAQIQIAPPAPTGPGAKLYEAKKSFANYYFNKLHRDRLLGTLKKQGDFSGLTGEWIIDTELLQKRKKGDARFSLREVGKKQQLVNLALDGIKYDLDLLKLDLDKNRTQEEIERELLQPTGSGGLMAALFHYRELLTKGDKGFTECYHGGHEPFFPPLADGNAPKSLSELRVDCEVILTEHTDIFGKWYFALKDRPGIPAGTLIGFEVTAARGQDPCEVYCYDFKLVDGRVLPHKLIVHSGNERFAVFNIKEYKLAKAN